MRSLVIYQGPSQIDGADIVAVAVYSRRNPKTGPMVQTYILRADMAPMAANKSGADISICGNCPLRGIPTDNPARAMAEGRGCYVVIAQGPTSVWKAFRQGAYAMAQGPEDIAAMGAGQMIRLGSYGDPGAVPLWVWRALVSKAAGWTGYTHNATDEGLFDLAMASVESLQDAQTHWAAGRRTFRVVRNIAEVDTRREVLCPASKEAGYRTTCAECRLCAGTATRSPKSVAIVAHGSGRKAVPA
jgi:hypothetical protein